MEKCTFADWLILSCHSTWIVLKILLQIINGFRLKCDIMCKKWRTIVSKSVRKIGESIRFAQKHTCTDKYWNDCWYFLRVNTDNVLRTTNLTLTIKKRFSTIKMSLPISNAVSSLCGKFGLQNSTYGNIIYISTPLHEQLHFILSIHEKTSSNFSEQKTWIWANWLVSSFCLSIYIFLIECSFFAIYHNSNITWSNGM